MQRKLLITYLFIILTTMLITIFISWNRIDTYFFSRVNAESESRVLVIKELLEVQNQADPEFLDDFVENISDKTGSRVTIIDMEGQVLAESDADKLVMDNHKSREEVANVIKNGGVYSAYRYSNTTQTYTDYVATTFEVDNFKGVLRTATPVNEIENLINDGLKIIFLGVLIGALVSFVLAYFVTVRLMKPVNELTLAAGRIAEGEYDEKIYIDQKDQIGELANAFNSMTAKLRFNLWELAQKNSELESILTSMTNGIMVVNTEFKITMYNKQFVKLFNIEDQDLTGKAFYEATRNRVVFDVLEDAYDQNQLIIKEAKIANNKTELIYMLYAMPIKSIKSGDQIMGTLLMVQDITQMRKLETMRSDFVSNVTHELKTPLTSIRGFVDTLKNGAINEDVAIKFLDIIDIEAERLEFLINDILILSEIEAMIGEKNQGEYQLTDVATEVIELLKPKLEKKGLQVITDFQESLPKYPCNVNRIKQLFINILDNAIKYTDSGSITISIRKEYTNFIIDVTDTGIGIEKSHIPRLFERFYRVDRGRSRKMGGTGLGLSIAKHIVELYNGRIKVKSQVDEGTSMIIYLPDR